MTEHVVALPQARARRQRPLLLLIRGTWRQTRTKIGVIFVTLLVATAVIGPFFSPYQPDEAVHRGDTYAAPFASPSSSQALGAALGTDTIGRDVLSRFLWGGRSVLALSALATVIGAVLGIAVGLLAAYSKGVLDETVMRAQDVVLAFPQLVFALVLVSTVGPPKDFSDSKLWLMILAVAVTTMPRVARVTRGAAVEVVERDFIRAAEGIGVPRSRILFGEILPNITSPLVVEVTLRLTFNIAVIAALSFLGFGLQPPAADWGLMVSENKQGLLTGQPWGVLMPVLAIGLLTVGTSLIGDGFARASIGIERGKGSE